MDLDERKITPLPPEFDIIVEMKTEDFHNMCKNLLTYGQFVIIECTDKKIELSDIIKTTNENSKMYYELKIKYEAWQEWYKEQKNIADQLKK